MLSIGAMVSGREDYYLGLAREDYYVQGGEPPGYWLGQSAAALGLGGMVSKQPLHNLLLGYSPDGEQALVQSAGKANRQQGWDLTFSAPKSVSVLWSQADPKVKQAIQAAHRRAVEEALGYLEERASFTRRGRGGHEWEPVGLAMAAFDHHTSREKDPQLHTHVLITNVGVRADGSTGTIRSKPYYQHKMTAGALYRAELATQLERALGVGCARTKTWFEVEGVPAQVLREFSKRRQQIEAGMEERGWSSARAAARVALDTRNKKDLTPEPREELFARWEAVGRSLGWGPEQTPWLLHRPRRLVHPERSLDAVVAGGLELLTYDANHFTERDLVRRMAEFAQGMGLTAQQVTTRADRELRTAPQLICLGEWEGDVRYTTRHVLDQEQKLLRLVEESQRDTRHVLGARPVAQAIGAVERAKGFPLSDEQRQAVERLTRAPGSIQVVSGVAGTGKTTMLEAARRAWESQGYRVRGAAIAAKAARGLEEGSGIPSTTVAWIMKSLDESRLPGRLKHHAQQLWRAARGRRTQTFQERHFAFDAKTVLVVDEGAMVSTPEMLRLVEAAQAADAKLVLVGDERQLQAIERGGAFGALGRRLGQAELTEVRRQEAAWARQAVADLAAGRTASAFREYADRRLVTVTRNREEAQRSLLGWWQAEGGAHSPQGRMILGTVKREVAELNALAQAARRSAGYLQGPGIEVKGQRFHLGDRVLFTRGSHQWGVDNGDLGTVTFTSRLLQTVRVRLDRGRSVMIPVLRFRDFQLGYAATTHKLQGATLDNAYILVGEQLQDTEMSYVQLSRARQQTRVFASVGEGEEGVRELADGLTRSRRKFLATEVAEQARGGAPQGVGERGHLADQRRRQREELQKLLQEHVQTQGR
ncbi:MAG: relaxase domain-containing protein [Armatimonadetes bacterium]|nr:relaxase domain-containing protein [Armatimonadota bacterium]